MAKVTFREERCKGCGLCIHVCPKMIIRESGRLNAKGYCAVEVSDMDKCIGCAFCATVCPDCVIEVAR